MTENKPVAWTYESRIASNGLWFRHIQFGVPAPEAYRRNIEPLYRHPPAPQQPATDPAVEAARRKALKAIFAKLEERSTGADRFTAGLPLAILRDLVGQPRQQPEQKVRGYDPAPPLTTDFLNEFLKAATAIYEKQPLASGPQEQQVSVSEDALAQALEADAARSKGHDPDWWLLTDDGREPWREKARRLIKLMHEAE